MRDFPASTEVSQSDVEIWLEGSRRIKVMFDVHTGQRREYELGLVPPERLQVIAALVWARFCVEPPPTLERLALNSGAPKQRAGEWVYEGIVLLQRALSGPD